MRSRTPVRGKMGAHDQQAIPGRCLTQDIYQRWEVGLRAYRSTSLAREYLDRLCRKSITVRPEQEFSVCVPESPERQRGSSRATMVSWNTSGVNWSTRLMTVAEPYRPLQSCDGLYSAFPFQKKRPAARAERASDFTGFRRWGVHGPNGVGP